MEVSKLPPRFEQIRERLHAYKHWKEKAGEAIDETHAPDMDYLLRRVGRLEKFAILVSTAGVPDINKLQEAADKALADEDEG
jgi:hypothetical protein